MTDGGFEKARKATELAMHCVSLERKRSQSSHVQGTSCGSPTALHKAKSIVTGPMDASPTAVLFDQCAASELFQDDVP